MRADADREREALAPAHEAQLTALGEALAEARRRADRSQADLAEICGRPVTVELPALF